VVERVVVPFAGEGSGTDELSWGQLSVWQSIQASGQSRTLGGMAPLPPDATLERIAGTVGRLVGRHQALRTTYRPRPGRLPLQVCHDRGELTIEVLDADGRDPDEVAEQLRDRYQRTPFDYEHEWPLRVGVVRADGRPVRQVVVYLHLALDAGGLTALVADMRRAAAGTGDVPPATGHPPLEQARRQRGAAAQRQQAGALRYWDQVLRAVPAQPLGPPRPGQERDHLEIRFRSPATLLAARLAAARTGTGTAPVLLAAYAVALARATDRNPVVSVVAVSNRFRPGLADSISSVSHIAPLLVDVADSTLGAAVGRASRGALAAYKSGYLDPYLEEDLEVRLAAELGTRVELICYFNDRRQAAEEPAEVPTAEQVRAALAESTVDWPEDPERPRTGLYLSVADAPGAVEFLLTVDLRYFTRTALEELVRGIEAVTVAIALDPTAGTGVRARAAATT